MSSHMRRRWRTISGMSAVVPSRMVMLRAGCIIREVYRETLGVTVTTASLAGLHSFLKPRLAIPQGLKPGRKEKLERSAESAAPPEAAPLRAAPPEAGPPKAAPPEGGPPKIELFSKLFSPRA